MSQPSVFRRMWQPPARFEDRSPDRSVTFLELFFDLVFVVIIAQLAHHLAEHPSWEGVGWFVFLFYAVWSSWLNGTLYHDLHTTNDVSVRVFTFAQMLAVAIMAVYVGDVPGEGSSGFALGYAANNTILVILWARTGIHDPAHRPASVPYSTAYFLSTLAFGLSVLVDEPLRYWMWAAGLLLEVAGFAVALIRFTPPGSQPGDATIAATPSLIERLGLFVIIVLGEVVVGAISGMAEVSGLGRAGILTGLLGVMVAIGLWWLYFDLISHRAPVSRRTQLWLYLHLPLVMAIAAGGAGVLNTVEHAGEPLPDAVRWLLVGSLAVAMAAILFLSFVLEARRRQPDLYRVVDIALIVGIVATLGIGLTALTALASLAAMVVLLLLPLGPAIAKWVKDVEIQA